MKELVIPLNLRIDDEEDNDDVATAREIFKEIDDIVKSIHENKVRKNTLKKMLVDLAKIEPVYNTDGTFNKFEFNEVLEPYVSFGSTDKSHYIVVDFSEYNCFLQVQAQSVLDWRRFSAHLEYTEKKEGNSKIYTTPEAVQMVKDIMKESSFIRLQSRIIMKGSTEEKE